MGISIGYLWHVHGNKHQSAFGGLMLKLNLPVTIKKVGKSGDCTSQFVTLIDKGKVQVL
jgi:hypothetical protein